MANLTNREATEVVREYYTSYARYVLETRALPSIYDGFKHVQRRTVYKADELPTKLTKSAKIIGLVTPIHPHGSEGIYGSLVNMTNATARFRLFKGKGNWGGYGFCFTGDTEVELLDGRSLPMRDIHSEVSEGKTLWVYASDKDGKILPKRITDSFESGVKKLVRVTLDNGEEITCTPDHPFMMRDGSFKPVSEIILGESLMPMYSKVKDSYRMVYLNDERRWEKSCRLIKDDYDPENGVVVSHHVDRNKSNDNPDNILWLTKAAHNSEHYLEKIGSPESMKKAYDNGIGRPEVRMMGYEAGLGKLTHEDHSANGKKGSDSFHSDKAKVAESKVKAVKTLLDNNPGHFKELSEKGGWKKARELNPHGTMRGRVINTYKNLLDAFGENSEISEENWNKACSLYGSGKGVKLTTAMKYFETTDDIKSAYLDKYNHQIVSVEYLDYEEMTYDITVEDFHTFALTAGVFVHNSAAAFRYTEAYLEDYARFGFTQFVNYSKFVQGEADEEEPYALPALIPYSHIAGSKGIGVGLSTNVMPLNLMDLIDYFIATIKGEEPVSPKPDVGNFILDMTDDYIAESTESIQGKIWVKSEVTQESSTILVVEDLFNKGPDKLTHKLRDLIDSGKVDFRDESTGSMRLAFEVMDPSVNVQELKERIEKLTKGSMTYTRLVVDEDKAVYCNLAHQVKKTLEFLNETLDNKFRVDEQKLRDQEAVLLVIEYIKSSGLVNNLGSMSTDDLRNDIIAAGYEKDYVYAAVRKPISYLTKSHDDELTSIRDSISEIVSIDRTDYLVALYEEYKVKLQPFYDSIKHSIPISQLLAKPRLELVNGNSFVVSDKGLDFDNKVLIVKKDGSIRPVNISVSTAKTINYDEYEQGDLVGFVTDKYRYGVAITNYNGVLAFDLNNLYYEKRVIRLNDGEEILEVIPVEENSSFVRDGVSYDPTNYLRSRVSKPIYNWTL